jgi:hypothetical protein
VVTAATTRVLGVAFVAAIAGAGCFAVPITRSLRRERLLGVPVAVEVATLQTMDGFTSSGPNSVRAHQHSEYDEPAYDIPPSDANECTTVTVNNCTAADRAAQSFSCLSSHEECHTVHHNGVHVDARHIVTDTSQEYRVEPAHEAWCRDCSVVWYRENGHAWKRYVWPEDDPHLVKPPRNAQVRFARHASWLAGPLATLHLYHATGTFDLGGRGATALDNTSYGVGIADLEGEYHSLDFRLQGLDFAYRPSGSLKNRFTFLLLPRFGVGVVLLGDRGVIADPGFVQLAVGAVAGWYKDESDFVFEDGVERLEVENGFHGGGYVAVGLRPVPAWAARVLATAYAGGLIALRNEFTFTPMDTTGLEDVRRQQGTGHVLDLRVALHLPIRAAQLVFDVGFEIDETTHDYLGFSGTSTTVGPFTSLSIGW